ncbi:MAG: TadE/TadG family type IV pilus assembly protein [Candidatus Binataceae bacterium]
MNSYRSARGFGANERGQSAVELALLAPVLILILLAAADFGRLFYTSIAVSNAARAGAQYGAQSVITAADANGMVAAAQSDGTNIADLTASAQQCTCQNSTSVALCPAAYCVGDTWATFVEVDTHATFNTLLSYPGVPSSVPLSGKAVMQVE